MDLQVIQLIVTIIGLLLVYIFQGRQIKSLKTEIESQNSIVDNAMKYAKDLDFDKVKGLIELEYKPKIDTIRKESEDRINDLKLDISQKEAVIKELNETLHITKITYETISHRESNSIYMNVIYPLFVFAVEYLKLDDDSKSCFISHFDSVERPRYLQEAPNAELAHEIADEIISGTWPDKSKTQKLYELLHGPVN